MIFDLDGTLAESKSSIDEEMAQLLSKLLVHHCVAVISGGDVEQFEKQLVAGIDKTSNLSNLYLFPTNATKMYRVTKDGLELVYREDLPSDLKDRVFTALKEASEGIDIPWGNSYSDIIEDRGSQITFSALGQKAPLELKRTWDADASKRKIMVERLEKVLPDLNIKIGGTTSIDITKKGIDKAYAVKKLLEFGFDFYDILFIGDALFEGGNDYAVRALGIPFVAVSNVAETKEAIAKMI